jgi:hypothetical protein
MGLEFEPLHGLLLALTPQEQPSEPATQSEVDLRRIERVEQLPPRLLMGYRDDASFSRTGDGFEVTYSLNGERVLELRLRGDQLWWRQWWHGLDGGMGAGPADQPDFITRGGLPLFPSWQDEIERELHALGNFEWARQHSDALLIAGLPDGVLVQVAFPTDGSALDELAAFYQDLWAEPTLRVRPIAYVLFTSLPVTHRWSPQAAPEAPQSWARHFWQTYSDGLGLQQPFPGAPKATGDGGTEITTAREGFLHVAMLPFRDLLPFAERLVVHGLVADHRFEDRRSDEPGWESATAPFRAVVAALGTAVDSDIAFSDDDGTIACRYPTATANRIYFDATEGDAFAGVGFDRVRELTRQYSGVIAKLNEQIRALTDEWKADPEAAAKRHAERATEAGDGPAG